MEDLWFNAEGGCGAGGTMCEGGRCPHDGELMNGGYVRKCHCEQIGNNDFSCCRCSRVKPDWGRYGDYQSEMMYNNDYYRAAGRGCEDIDCIPPSYCVNGECVGGGRSVDPTDPRWRDRRYSRFTGPNNEHQPGNFLTDDPGDTQSMTEFINDVP